MNSIRSTTNWYIDIGNGQANTTNEKMNWMIGDTSTKSDQYGFSSFSSSIIRYTIISAFVIKFLLIEKS